MKTTLKIVAVLALVVGLVMGLKLMKSQPHHPTDPVNPETSAVDPAHSGGAAYATQGSPTKPAANVAPAVETSSNAMAAAETATPGAIPDWEQKIDDLLASSKEPAETGKEILAMFPKLSADGQIAAAGHISNLLADEDYAPFASYLTNAATSTEVQDLIFADLLNRPNGIKLPMLLEVARNGKPDQASEAKDFLEIFVGEDYGTDWSTWSVKVKEWLKENPDEPVPGSNGTGVSN